MSKRHGNGTGLPGQDDNGNGRDDSDIEALGGEPLDANKLYNSQQLKRAMSIGWRVYEGLMEAGMPYSVFRGRYYFSGRKVIEFFEGLGDGGQA